MYRTRKLDELMAECESSFKLKNLGNNLKYITRKMD